MRVFSRSSVAVVLVERLLELEEIVALLLETVSWQVGLSQCLKQLRMKSWLIPKSTQCSQSHLQQVLWKPGQEDKTLGRLPASPSR